MESNKDITNIQANEYILVYPHIKQVNDYSDTKKFLTFFRKPPKKSSFIYQSEKDVTKMHSSKKSLNIEKEKLKDLEKKLDQDKDKNNDNDISNYYLINKDIELRNSNLKRTLDIKHALENFLRKSDLIEKIGKFFEEFHIQKSKMSAKKEKKEGKVEEENEKVIDTYIESIISKLADNVVIEKYKKNDFIMKMNDIGDNCYFLISGTLSVLKPVEYHVDVSYDDYMQYIANVLKYNENEFLENIRHVNPNFIDVGLVEDLKDLIKSYFIIKLNKDVNNLIINNNFDISFIKKRFELFNLSFEDFGLSSEQIYYHINEINKGSLVKEMDLKDFLNKIIMPKPEHYSRLVTNPHIFDEDKHKVTIMKYEDFLYLKPGSFFGETALDSKINKRNASIRAEEDCIILSLKNEIYKSLLQESNKKLKSFDVIFICKNFFFNDISPLIFNRRYFSLFKLLNKKKDDILYGQNERSSSVYFIKEGNARLVINASMLEIYNLIKKYFETLVNNPFLKLEPNEIKEIKKIYLEDTHITDIRHQSFIFKEQINTKRKFELYSSNLFDTLGLEEFFLNTNYLCSCKIISTDAKIFEISSDSLNIIISNEKEIHYAFYNLIRAKLISFIKRLHMIKNYYINQINFKIKANFFGTEVPPDRLIKGQTGDNLPYSKYYKRKPEQKIIKTYDSKIDNEEIKNDIFALNKTNLKYHTRNNKYWNPEFNTISLKGKESLTYDNFMSNKKPEKKPKFKIKNKNNSPKKNTDKNNILFKVNKEKKKLASSNKIKNLTENINDKDLDTERKNRIMETTVIRIGMDYLSLKEIGNRVKNPKSKTSYELSIVKNNYYYKTYNNIKNNSFLNNNSTEKSSFQTNKTKNHSSVGNVKGNILNNKSEPFSLKNNIMSMTYKNRTNYYNNKLPHILINTYNNFTNLLNKSNLSYYNKYSFKNKTKTNLFKSSKIGNKNYGQNTNYNRTFFDKNKNSFNVILTNDSNPNLKEKSKSKSKSKSNKKKLFA